MHWDSASESSLPGRWLISPTPTPNSRPSDRIVFRIWELARSAEAGAKR
jgi:hypothetical protein